jgi:hypothetical protein
MKTNTLNKGEQPPETSYGPCTKYTYAVSVVSHTEMSRGGPVGMMDD